MVQLGFRNGFGLDVESVSAMPLWCWVAGDDPSEDPPMVGVFDGLIFKLPFLFVYWGSVYSADYDD